MDLRLVPLTHAHALDVVTWRYPPPYDSYDMTDADPDALIDPALRAHAVVDGHDLLAFRTFGEDGRVPGWEYDDRALDTGGGLRPDLVGRGLGREVVAAGLAFGEHVYAPPAFRVTVATSNARALRTVESLGFVGIGEFAGTARSAVASGRRFRVLVRPVR